MTSRAERRLAKRKRLWTIRRALILVAVIVAVVIGSYIERGYWAVGCEPFLAVIGAILIADGYERRWNR